MHAQHMMFLNYKCVLLLQTLIDRKILFIYFITWFSQRLQKNKLAKVLQRDSLLKDRFAMVVLNTVKALRLQVDDPNRAKL